MKKSSLKLTKMQRRVRARRKTWTNAERYENRIKNAKRLALLQSKDNPLVQKFIEQAEQELEHEHEHEHTHDEKE